MKHDNPALVAAIDAIADLVAERVANRLMSHDYADWVDQASSPLGPRRHRAAVCARLAAGASGAARVGRRHLLSKDALAAELGALATKRPKRATVTPAEPTFEQKLRAELRLVGGDS